MYDISGIPPRRVAVVGQGYVGLPLAIRAVEVGFDVVGFDIDKARVDFLRKAKTFIDDITDDDLAVAASTGRYLPTDDPEALAGFDVAVVCVPTPLRDGAPDLSCVEAAAGAIAPHITMGTPGTPGSPRRSPSPATSTISEPTFARSTRLSLWKRSRASFAWFPAC